MGLFNFLRKHDEKREKVRFGELESWVNNQKGRLVNQEKDLLKRVTNCLSELLFELRQELVEIGKINLEDRKETEQIKLIVRKNLSNYHNYLEKLIYNLDSIQGDNILNLINNLLIALEDFDKKSSSSYEKATLLVGVELGNVRRSIGKFVSILNEVKASEYFSLSEKVSIIEEAIKKIQQLDKIIDDVQETYKRICREIDNLKKEYSQIIQTVKKIKESEEYKEFLSKLDKYQREKEELKTEIYKVKSIINFKNLSCVFHSNEQKMQIVNSYRDNFSYMLETEGGDKLISLLKEAGYASVADKINELLYKIRAGMGIPKEETIDKLEAKKNQIQLEISLLNKEIAEQNKRQIKMERDRNNLINSIKNIIIELNLDFQE